MQETRLGIEGKCLAGMTVARGEKWKVKLCRAQITKKGYTSGRVAVAGRAHFGIVDPQFEGIQVDTTRIACAHNGAICRGGMYCFPIYLVTCEGMSERNGGILLELARMIKAIKGPRVVMGDWNMPPEVLHAAGWVDEVEGKIVAPTMPTCKGSVIDLFVVDRRLMNSILYVKRM